MKIDGAEVESRPVIWTVGHSNYPFERLAQLLWAEGVEFVVDVRSYPYSRVAPQFNRVDLEESLRGEGSATSS